MPVSTDSSCPWYKFYYLLRLGFTTLGNTRTLHARGLYDSNVSETFVNNIVWLSTLRKFQVDSVKLLNSRSQESYLPGRSKFILEMRLLAYRYLNILNFHSSTNKLTLVEYCALTLLPYFWSHKKIWNISKITYAAEFVFKSAWQYLLFSPRFISGSFWSRNKATRIRILNIFLQHFNI